MKIKTIPFILAAAMLTASCGKQTNNEPTTETEKSSAVSIEVQDNVKSSEEDNAPADENSAAANATEEKSADENKTGKTVVHLACAGDNLIHDNIYVEAQQEDGSYDFSKCYAPCKKLIDGTDIAILNQETLVNDAFEPSTFPMFSTPTEVGDAVVDFGFKTD